MSEALEMAIRDLLISEGNSNRVAESFIKRIFRDGTEPAEVESFLNFLIQAGYYQELLKFFAHELRLKHTVHLLALCHLLHKSGFQPHSDFLNSLFIAQDNSKESYTLSHYSPWESLDPRFVELKATTLNKLREHHLAERESLIQKLEFFRNHRMLEEEKKLLLELANRYPGDPQFYQEQEEFHLRWARSVISRKATDLLDVELDPTEEIFSEQAIGCIQAILSTMKFLAQRDPRLAYDFAIGFYFLDLFENAREILDYAQPSLSVDWFQVELLLKSRRYVECLDFIQTVEKRYANDPETTFGATYYRALALGSLGQTSTAIELLKSIVTIRPHYRSAHALLLKWGGLP